MNELLYRVNDELVPASEASVSVNDRGFKYGDAAFETIRAYGGQPFEWDRHFDRLHRSCELLNFEPGYDSAELLSLTRETLAANDLSEAYIRLSLTRGEHSGKLTPPSDPDPTLVIIVSSLPRGGTDGKSVWDHHADVEIVDTVRTPDSAVPAAAKTHNYLNGILARGESDMDEALLLDYDGNLAEGATSNLFFCCDGTIKTPSLDGPILPGITREVVIELAGDHDIDVDVDTYSPDDLQQADGAFLTNTTWEIRPIARLGTTRIGACKHISAIQKAFSQYVESTHYS